MYFGSEVFFLVSILVLPHQSSHDMKVVIDLGRESSHNTIHILYWFFSLNSLPERNQSGQIK